MSFAATEIAVCRGIARDLGHSVQSPVLLSPGGGPLAPPFRVLKYAAGDETLFVMAQKTQFAGRAVLLRGRKGGPIHFVEVVGQGTEILGAIKGDRGGLLQLDFAGGAGQPVSRVRFQTGNATLAHLSQLFSGLLNGLPGTLLPDDLTDFFGAAGGRDAVDGIDLYLDKSGQLSLLKVNRVVAQGAAELTGSVRKLGMVAVSSSSLATVHGVAEGTTRVEIQCLTGSRMGRGDAAALVSAAKRVASMSVAVLGEGGTVVQRFFTAGWDVFKAVPKVPHAALPAVAAVFVSLSLLYASSRSV